MVNQKACEQSVCDHLKYVHLAQSTQTASSVCIRPLSTSFLGIYHFILFNHTYKKTQFGGTVVLSNQESLNVLGLVLRSHTIRGKKSLESSDVTVDCMGAGNLVLCFNSNRKNIWPASYYCLSFFQRSCSLRLRQK